MSGKSERTERSAPSVYVDRDIKPRVYQCWYPDCIPPPPPPAPNKTSGTAMMWSDPATWQNTSGECIGIFVTRFTELKYGRRFRHSYSLNWKSNHNNKFCEFCAISVPRILHIIRVVEYIKISLELIQRKGISTNECFNVFLFVWV